MAEISENRKPVYFEANQVKLKGEREILLGAGRILDVPIEVIHLLLKMGFPYQKLKLICAIWELNRTLVYDIPMKDKYLYVAMMYGYSISSVRQFHRNYGDIYKLISQNETRVQNRF